MSTFYNFISLSILDKLNPSVLKKTKSLDQVEIGQSFIIFPNLKYLYAQNIDVDFIYSVERFDNNVFFMRDVVFVTIVQTLNEIIIASGNVKDADWLKSSIESRNVCNTEEFLLYGTKESSKVINILKKYYSQYKQKIVNDCVSNKITSITSIEKPAHILINEMMEIYTEIMKVFNVASKNNGVVYIPIR